MTDTADSPFVKPPPDVNLVGWLPPENYPPEQLPDREPPTEPEPKAGTSPTSRRS